MVRLCQRFSSTIVGAGEVLPLFCPRKAHTRRGVYPIAESRYFAPGQTSSVWRSSFHVRNRGPIQAICTKNCDQ
jgi:hypothetical protein